MTDTLKRADVEYPPDMPRPAKHFISKLLALDPARRSNPEQALDHSWITGKPMMKKALYQNAVHNNLHSQERQRTQKRPPFSRGPIPREKRFFHSSSPKPFNLFNRYSSNQQNGTTTTKSQSAGSFTRFWKDREKSRDERHGSISSSFRFFRRHRGSTQENRIHNKQSMTRSASYRADGRKSPRKFRSHSLSSALRRSSSRDSGYSAR